MIPGKLKYSSWNCRMGLYKTIVSSRTGPFSMTMVGNGRKGFFEKSSASITLWFRSICKTLPISSVSRRSLGIPKRFFSAWKSRRHKKNTSICWVLLIVHHGFTDAYIISYIWIHKHYPLSNWKLVNLQPKKKTDRFLTAAKQLRSVFLGSPLIDICVKSECKTYLWPYLS